MIKISLFLAILVNSLVAVEIPITQVMNFDVSFGKFNIIEFPFKIKSIDKATFIPRSLLVKQKKNGQITDITEDGDSISDVAEDAVVITRGTNTLTMFPKRYGVLRLVVWGYKFPVMIEVKTVKNDYPKFYRLKDYKVDKKAALNFESTSHEKVITKLIKYLFNKETPKGFQNRSKDLTYTSQGLKVLYNRALLGQGYLGDEWIVENITDGEITLYEEMFYKDGIYAVSIENDKLKPGEKCRVFVVRNASK